MYPPTDRHIDRVDRGARHTGHDRSLQVLGASVMLPYDAAWRCVRRLLQSTRRCAGFTLIEVMIATVVLSVGFLGLSAMSLGTIRGISYSANLSKATALAREQLERIENTDYDTVIADNYPQEAYNTMAGFEQFQRTVTIANDTPQATAKTVTVTVSRRHKAGIIRTVTLSTIIMP